MFLGGSNLGVSANSDNPELAVDLLEIIAGEEFQSRARRARPRARPHVAARQLTGSPAAEAQAKAAANSRFVPASENWAAVEGANVLQDMGVAIAQGADVRAEAQRADEAVEDFLNG